MFKATVCKISNITQSKSKAFILLQIKIKSLLKNTRKKDGICCVLSQAHLHGVVDLHMRCK